MNTLVVNLTRMGDLLQTTPLLKGLKEQDPDGRLDLMVVEDFHAVADGFDMVDEVLTLDLNGLIPRFDISKITVVNLHSELTDWIASIRNRSYDCLINLSHTRISAALVRLLDVPDTRGVTLSREGYILIRHPWLNYFFNVTISRAYNPINLVDMYLAAGNITQSPGKVYYTVPENAEAFTESYLSEKVPLSERTLYGIQPGAMQESRSYPVDRWAQLCDSIWEELGGVAVLFGASSDVEIGYEIESGANHPVINAIGQTTIPQLGGLLKRCRVLVTNDTGTMHMANAVGTPIVAIFLAAARAEDTAPYGHGHLVLEANIDCAPCNYHRECANQVCHKMITPETILEAIRLHPILHTGIVPQFQDDGQWKTVRISMTDMNSWGQNILVPCIRRPYSRRQVLAEMYRFLWRMELCPDPDSQDYDGYENALESVLEYYHNPDQVLSFQEDLASLDKLMELASMGLERAEIMIESSKNPNPNFTVLQNIVAHFVIIDRDIYEWELTHPDLAPLAIHFRINKGNIEQDDLNTLSGVAKSLYSDLKRRAERCQHLLQVTEQTLEKRMFARSEVMAEAQ